MSGQDGVSVRPRRSFGKIEKIVEIPNLIDVQKRSYERFLQRDVPSEERQDIDSYINRKDMGAVSLGDMLQDQQLLNGTLLDQSKDEETTEE